MNAPISLPQITPEEFLFAVRFQVRLCQTDGSRAVWNTATTIT